MKAKAKAGAKERAVPIKMIIMDVDGTLTDGSLLIMPDGEEVKSFNVRDGMGVLLARLAGIQAGIITGKISKSLEKRAEKLRINEIYQGVRDKKEVMDRILKENNLVPKEVAYIGDDLGDVDVIKTVGLSAAVADAHPEVKKHSHFICSLGGGKGAVREFVEFILHAQGKWERVQAGIKEIFDQKPQSIGEDGSGD